MPDEPLTLPRALNPDGILILGSLLVKQLQANGSASFFVNSEGVIELAPPIELGMDYLPEQSALRHLREEHQYTDTQLASYLKARDSRKARHGQDL